MGVKSKISNQQSKMALLVLCLLLALTAGARAADDEMEEEARRKYESTFEEGLKGKQRVQMLEQIAEEYKDTRWCDDALWVLSEMADRGGYLQHAIRFRKQLAERKARTELEPFTRRQRIYVKSRARSVDILLLYTGDRYAVRGETVVMFNPVPDSVKSKIYDSRIKGLKDIVEGTSS